MFVNNIFLLFEKLLSISKFFCAMISFNIIKFLYIQHVPPHSSHNDNVSRRKELLKQIFFQGTG